MSDIILCPKCRSTMSQSIQIAEAFRENAILRQLLLEHLCGEAFADRLVRSTIIHRDSVEDPEGYDGGATLDRVFKLASELRDLFISEQAVQAAIEERMK